MFLIFEVIAENAPAGRGSVQLRPRTGSHTAAFCSEFTRLGDP